MCMENIYKEVDQMKNIGALYKCDICGKEEFLKRTHHTTLSGGWGCREKFDESEGWVYKSKIGDICPNCSNKLQDKIISKYGISKKQARCYLKIIKIDMFATLTLELVRTIKNAKK